MESFGRGGRAAAWAVASVSSLGFLGARRGSRRWRFAASLALVCFLFWASVSCRNLSTGSPSVEPRAEALRGELAVVVSRLGAYPIRIVTGAEKIPVRFVFDPEIVDVRKATHFSLWCFQPDARGWKRIATVPAGSQPWIFEPEEGVLGLSASVIFADGVERLVPRPGDPPALWLCVDRSPPSIHWIQPHEGISLKGLRTLELKWAANEIHFGSSYFLLQWSADRGKTWKPIVTLPAKAGLGSYEWRIPREVCSDVSVRLVARDLAGHESSAAVALSYPGSMEGTYIASKDRDAPADSYRSGTEAAKPPAKAEAKTPPSSSEVGAVATAAGDQGAAPAAERAKVSKARPEVGPVVPGSDASREAASRLEGARFPISLEPLPGTFLRGGEEVKISWRWEGRPAPEGTAAVEWSSDGGATWAPVADSPISSQSVSWEVPRTTASACFLRLRVSPEGARSFVVESSEPFSIDSEPPRVALCELPSPVGADLKIPVAFSDPGGSGIHRVEAYVRPKASRAWIELPEGRALLEGSDVRIDLGDFEEGEYELYVRAFDRVGNATPAPGSDPDSQALDEAARVALKLDRTPPSIRARRGTGSWVSGFPADAEVSVDWAEAVPPLVVEGREPEGPWTEIARFPTIAPGESRFTFRIPGAVRAYSVRFVVADAAGNLARAEIGPERVDSPIRLKSFTEEAAYPPGTLQKVLWELAPAAAGSGEGLIVRVEHRPAGGAEWKTLCEVSPEKQFLWELPAAGSEEHRLRVELVRAGEVLGEDVSARFRISGGEGPAPTAIAISEDSLFYSRRARETIEKYFAGLRDLPPGAAEIEALKRSALSDLGRAIEIDPKNYQATYSLAGFLNRTDPSGNFKEVRKWLEKTVEIKPDHASALNDLGACCLLENDCARAEEYLRKSLSVRRTAAGLYNLGLALYYREKHSEAAEAFRGALAAGGGGEVGEGEIYYYLVQCTAREGNAEAARALYREKAGSIPEDLRAELSGLLSGP